MVHLNPQWLEQSWMDIEYKQYLILAYAQGVEEKFEKGELYPYFGELIAHLSQLEAIYAQSKSMYKQSPEFSNMLPQEDAFTIYLEEMYAFTKPIFTQLCEQGKAIFETVENSIQIQAIGLQPAQKQQGFMCVSVPNNKLLKIYTYSEGLFYVQDMQVKALKTQLLQHKDLRIGLSLQDVKLQLLKQKSIGLTPAVYSIQSTSPFQFEYTVFPIMKRVFAQYIQKVA